MKHVSDALQLEFKPLEDESNIKTHVHSFLYPSPDGYHTEGRCSCGAMQKGFNSDRFLEGRRDNGMRQTIQSNPVRFLPDNPVDCILEHGRGRRIHIWQRENISY